ncbi:hypothetical protein CERSUDRAFT_159446 [Gelatoporia subvermispora B]|uniref:Post-SET domain-containing protein n=1 Tax=Ceriporiopsis subvermispora (strain B) TaxID=914234 RepID=M2QPE8_CERS8|nr:hypothetical protein CERSUDRAFT_159446 [Gelatoporia subvermispora B]
MADNSLHSMTSTLGTQPLSLSDASHHAPHPQNAGESISAPPIDHASAPPTFSISTAEGTSPEVPVKRKPGRPKGSGKKPVDPNAEPKIKRPVGRPRKDGLPAGSVGPRRVSRTRKRPPGTFASGLQQPAPLFYPPPYGIPPEVANAQWRASISVPPMGSISRASRPPPMNFPIDPNLDRDNWADLSRTRADVFLQSLVAALASPNPVSGAGPSVEESFKSHLVSLAPQSKSGPSSIPTLYSILKTFWLPASPVYFSLTASASTARTPSEHRFFYWDPQPLVFNGIACPACSVPLINNGRITSGPIKVYDLGKPFFIIGCEYVCKGPQCTTGSPDGRKFASTDTSILRALPSKLKDEFPAHLLQGGPDLGAGPDVWNWHGMGVSIALWNMVRASLRVGLRKDAILDVIASIQSGISEDDQLKYEDGDAEQSQPGMSSEVEGEEDDDTGDAERVEGDLEPGKDKSTEEFNEAWNANSGVVADANPAPEQAGPSNVVDTHPHVNQSPVQPPMDNRPPPFPPYSQAPYMPYPYPPPYPYYPVPPGQHPDPNNGNPLKRTFAIVDGTPDPSLAEPVQKRIRHCCKCGSNECKGKGGRAFCTNPCQDCGKMDCKGRNSKRPDRTCSDAWP